MDNAQRRSFPPIFSVFRKQTPSAFRSGSLPHQSTAAVTPTTETRNVLTESDRREQRLARNRESARQSRRRKKENLENLSAKLGQSNMELEDLRHVIESNLRSQEDCTEDERQALRAYRFARLRCLLFPPHACFWMWLNRRACVWTQQASSSQRISAAKIGETLIQEQQEQESETTGWEAKDGQTLWPLLCFELQLKGEQEEQVKAILSQASEEMTQELEALQKMASAVGTLYKDLCVSSKRVDCTYEAVRGVLTRAQLQVLRRYAVDVPEAT